MLDPRGPIGSIDLHDVDRDPGFPKQTRELQRLVGHAPRGRRQRPDEADGDSPWHRYAPALPATPPAINWTASATSSTSPAKMSIAGGGAK